ncbi:SAM-dependent methyltransferase [Aeromicrobium sp. A1-2]|nr:SAM-dependent methyltransferase [Aeromicrobium sp. A1-2]
MLAQDSVDQIGSYQELDGRRVMDVGGGPGYFANAFRAAGATYGSLDADLGELSGLGDPEPGTVLGSGMQLPFRDESFDVTYSSNVLEHVSQPWTMADEMVRVTKPGGLVFLSYTLWFGPWGGHETAPWHFLGGHRAARRYEAKHGHEPKNLFGTSLFVITAGGGIAWAGRQADADIVAVIPRYLPRWSWWVLKVPGLRELVTWNLAIVLRKR